MFDFSKTYTLPFKYKIPNYIDFHLKDIPKFKRFVKFLRRCVFILVRRQKNLEVFSILPKHKKILWINISAPSLGDSLMDLSSRIMLTNKNIDLFTDIKNAHIYADDIFFNNVYVNVSELKNHHYDLVILDSFSSRSMNIKFKLLPSLPFVGMFGFFNGPEVNRILFSFHQMNHLLGYIKSEEEINNISTNTITISKKDTELIKAITPKIYITIAIGGEWEYKIYGKWGDLIQKITSNYKKINIVLVGSKNAQNESIELIERFNDVQFIDLVSKLSFNQTAEVIKHSQALICCDGGLMHAASAVNANIISLLARLAPEMLFADDNALCLFDENDVNNIKVEDVLIKYDKLASLFDIHLQDE